MLSTWSNLLTDIKTLEEALLDRREQALVLENLPLAQTLLLLREQAAGLRKNLILNSSTDSATTLLELQTDYLTLKAEVDNLKKLREIA